jgi:hypothetical protein
MGLRIRKSRNRSKVHRRSKVQRRSKVHRRSKVQRRSRKLKSKRRNIKSRILRKTQRRRKSRLMMGGAPTDNTRNFEKTPVETMEVPLLAVSMETAQQNDPGPGMNVNDPNWGSWNRTHDIVSEVQDYIDAKKMEKAREVLDTVYARLNVLYMGKSGYIDREILDRVYTVLVSRINHVEKQLGVSNEDLLSS